MASVVMQDVSRQSVGIRPFQISQDDLLSPMNDLSENVSLVQQLAAGKGNEEEITDTLSRRFGISISKITELKVLYSEKDGPAKVRIALRDLRGE